MTFARFRIDASIEDHSVGKWSRPFNGQVSVSLVIV